MMVDTTRPKVPESSYGEVAQPLMPDPRVAVDLIVCQHHISYHPITYSWYALEGRDGRREEKTLMTPPPEQRNKIFHMFARSRRP